MSQAINLQCSRKQSLIDDGTIWGTNPWENPLVVTSNYSFESSLDGNTIIKYLKGLTINAGCTLTTSQRCKGLVLFVKGDCIINGTLSMTARGAKAVGDNLAIDYQNAEFLVNPANLPNYEYTVASEGGAGGAITGGYYSDATNYNFGANPGTSSAVSCGGGGGGGCVIRKATGYSGAGAKGTSYSGGAGGGGQGRYNVTGIGYGGAAGANGGAGGWGSCYTGSGATYKRGAGGGAGNAGGGGCGTYGYAGASGTGGLLVLVVRGNLSIGANGSIISNGSPGGYVHTSYNIGGGGGGSGGGNIIVLYSGLYTNNGTIQANGGAGGWGSSYGGSGGAGALKINAITL